MTSKVQYISDSKGKTSAVIIQFKDWKMVQEKLKSLEKEKSILLGIKNALKEISDLESKRKKTQTLNEFLNEL